MKEPYRSAVDKRELSPDEFAEARNANAKLSGFMLAYNDGLHLSYSLPAGDMRQAARTFVGLASLASVIVRFWIVRENAQRRGGPSDLDYDSGQDDDRGLDLYREAESKALEAGRKAAGRPWGFEHA